MKTALRPLYRSYSTIYTEVTLYRSYIYTEVTYIQKLHYIYRSYSTIKKTRQEVASPALREKCPYTELFWSALSRIRTEYSVRMGENTDQNISEYGHFLRSAVQEEALSKENFLWRLRLFQIIFKGNPLKDTRQNNISFGRSKQIVFHERYSYSGGQSKV